MATPSTEPIPILKQLGARIRAMREELHMSQKEFAAVCQIDAGSLCRLEHGSRNTTVLHLARLAQGLDVDIVDLLKP
ncbi:MAG TPA: helix-turn-helix transcriptional regulator [Vicinamibacterales bacterium]|nr:helix-turn-helix transcriptional regulator [Vicinamibacterales bacterium]